jgi:hypothetical protein
VELLFENAPVLWRQYVRGALVGTKRFPAGRFHRRIPDASARLRHVSPERANLAAYRHICGFDDGDHLPLTYPALLATPVAAAMLVESDFPYPILGVVHVRQTITQHRPIENDEGMSVHTWFGDEREVARGVEFTTQTEIHCGHELVWEAAATALVRDPTKPRGKRSEPDSEKRGLESTRFSIAGDMGRRYAKISQDYNPIHLWPITAKPFGFARPIVHGMWSLARGLAACQSELPGGPLRLSCSFKKPVMLPCEVRLFRYADDSGIGFSLRDHTGDKKHLECSICPI